MKQRNIRILVFCIVILIGIIFYLSGSTVEVIKGLGIELSSAGFIAILLELILKDEFLDEIKNKLRSPFEELGTC